MLESLYFFISDSKEAFLNIEKEFFDTEIFFEIFLTFSFQKTEVYRIEESAKIFNSTNRFFERRIFGQSHFKWFLVIF